MRKSYPLSGIDYGILSVVKSVGSNLSASIGCPDLLAAEKKQFIDDQRKRNAVEGKIGECKRRYGLGLDREKLIMQGSSIAMNILLMNLQKLLQLIFVFIGLCWQLLIATTKIHHANKIGRASCRERV